MKHSKKTLSVTVILSITAVVGLCLILFSAGHGKTTPASRHARAKQSDFQHIDTETYDTVFLSMFPIDAFNEEDYARYRAMTLLKSEAQLSGINEFIEYMQHIDGSGNKISTAYLGVIPGDISPSEILSLAQAHPSVLFEVILSAPHITYWQSLKEKAHHQLV